jgi:hypothetical protein
MCLESGIAHDVKAPEESAFLITVCWPGGSAEERRGELNTGIIKLDTTSLKPSSADLVRFDP